MSFLKTLYSKVTGTGGSDENGDNKEPINKNKKPEFNNTSSKSSKPPNNARGRGRGSTHNTKSAPAINPNKTRNAENKSEIHQEAEKSFQQIAIAHSKINKKFFTISNNKTTKREVYLELIEELDQLVFSLDKAEVTNNQELKDERRSLLLSIQALSKQAKQKIQINNKKNEKVAVKNEEVDPFEDFFKFGNDTYQNWVGNLPNTQELNQNTNGEIFSIETVPQQTGYMIENSLVEETSTDNNSSIELGTKVAVESKDNVLEEITVLNEASNVEELRHENVGTLAMTEDTGILQHENGTAAVAKEEILVNQGEPDVQQVQSDIITPTDNSEESMDFEIIQSGLQEYQESVRDLPTSDNQMCLFQDDVMAMEQHGQACYQITLSETRESKPVPIQLLIQNSEGMFELDEAAVKRVLCGDDVKNRKIAIVSVVGAFRRGKSFLLNFMLRYLNAKGHPDWLTESDEVGGFSWRGGKERETTGILMWPQAFLVGHKLALILLDTQGTFDKHTSMKENTFIFALSTLLSSVQIYNLQDRIQMDDLNNLQYFLEFGRMVETACNTKVFDNLIFLIRDWKHEDENAFGFEGGHQELQEWFNMDHNSVTKQQAEMINTCFKCIECFLMPHPGKKVAASHLYFQGSLKDIRPQFLEHLKLFVESVLHPGKLAVKQIGGEFVTAENFLAYMKNYVEKLQHPDLEPKTLFQSMSETCHEKALSEAKQTYMSKMESGLTDATVDIQDLHQTAVLSAYEVFDSIPKFGSTYNTTSYKNKLKEHLDELYSRYAREFERHKDSQFHAACSDIYETYQTTLMTFCMQLHHDCTLEEKCKEACQHAVDTFFNLKFKVPQELWHSKLQELKKKMQQFYTQQVPYFKARQEFVQSSKSKELLSAIKREVVKCYQHEMDVHCAGPDPVPDLVAVHARAEITALNLLHAQIEEHQLAECHQLQLEIHQEIDDIYKIYTAHDVQMTKQREENKFQWAMSVCHHEALFKYQGLMEERCGGLKAVENIEQLHKEASKKSLASFGPLFKVYGEACKTFHSNSKEAINTLFSGYHHNNEEKLRRNTRERALQLENEAYQKYEVQMESLHIGRNPVQDLQKLHDKFYSEAIAVLEPIRHSAYYHNTTIKNLAERVNKRSLYYSQINSARLRQALLENIQKKFDESVKYYQDKMDELQIDVRPVEDLHETHNLFMSEAKNMLVEFSEMENYVSFVDQFKQEIEKKWLVYQEKDKKVREIFLNEEKRTVLQLYNNMRTEYTTNMQRQMSAAVDTKDSSLLYQEHRKQREACLANFQELVKECSEENKVEFYAKLQEDIQDSYENTEETYAKNLRDLRVKEEKLREGALKTYAIGIDLGTTNCCAAVFKEGKVRIITNSIDKTTTPSVVCFKDHETVFGETAVRAGVAYPANCIAEMKRIIGRKYDDPVVQARMKKWQFKVMNSEGMPAVHINNDFITSSYKPEEISALVLGEMKRIAEVYLGSKVHDAVVTIPAYFNELQREATKTACVKAGLNVLRMLNEPTAAAIAYGLQCESEDPCTVLVFDFGGGTCDISIMTIRGKTFVVKASVGDNVLGGEDFDDRLTDYVVEILEDKYEIQIDNSGRRRLRIACETTKRKLSIVYEYELEVDEFIYNGTDKVDIKINIKKNEFEKLTKDLVERALTPVKDCLREAKMEPQDIDKVVLVGGSSKMPRIQELLKTFFQKEQLDMRINPDEAIAYGAAIQAAVSCGELSGYDIQEITPFSLGIKVINNKMNIIIPKNTKIPVSRTSIYSTTAHYQNAIGIDIYQGECTEDAKQNTRLGEYKINNIKKAPAGETSVFVTFTIDEDGILHTETIELGNQKNKKSLTIEKKVL